MRSPSTILLDTDMGNDIDDALALVMLHKLEDAGECRLLGIAVSKDNPWAVAYTRLVNARCGRPDLPVGLVGGGVTPEEGQFIRAASEYVGVDRSLGDHEDAVVLLRRLLAGQDDGSVTMITIGFFSNLSRLLDSPPDEISSLEGYELLARKVCSVVSMAAGFAPTANHCDGSDPGNPEFNIRMDIPAARNFIVNCPCPMVFSGYEIGLAVHFPGAVIEAMLEATPKDIIARGYELYLPMPYDRPSWDQTAVIQAVRPEAGYFDLSASGCVEIDGKGRSTFMEDLAGTHHHLILRAGQAETVRTAIIDLCTRT